MIILLEFITKYPSLSLIIFLFITVILIWSIISNILISMHIKEINKKMDKIIENIKSN